MIVEFFSANHSVGSYGFNGYCSNGRNCIGEAHVGCPSARAKWSVMGKGKNIALCDVCKERYENKHKSK